MPFENFEFILILLYHFIIIIIIKYVGLDVAQPSGLGWNGSSSAHSNWVGLANDPTLFFLNTGLDSA